MFLFALMVFGLAAALMQLGAYSVWVSILSAILKLVLLVLLVGLLVWVIAFCWKRFTSP